MGAQMSLIMLLTVKGKIARFAGQGCLGSHGGVLFTDAALKEQQHTALEKRGVG